MCEEQKRPLALCRARGHQTESHSSPLPQFLLDRKHNSGVKIAVLGPFVTTERRR